jgi:prepilin-type N-terminal cleavage/methylation domain-containing protein
MLRSEAGFTLIEVLVSAMIVALVGTAGATAFIVATHASGFTRLRSDAQTLAQQDQNRLRGLNIDELSNLNQTLTPVTLDGAAFTVKEGASYVSDAVGAPSCTNPSADYLEVTSTVTWSNMGSAAPITASSVLTPTVGSVDPTNGTLAVSVINAAGSGVAGANVSISGPHSDTAQTAAGGCALFGDIPPGAYNVAVSPETGTYVDAQSGQAVSVANPDIATATVTAGTTAGSPTQFQIDAGGSIVPSFVTAYPTGVSPAVPAPATSPAVVVFNTSLKPPGYRVCSAADAACPAVGSVDATFPVSVWSAAGATPLFPYTYSVWAGSCLTNEPKFSGGVDASGAVTAGTSKSVSLTLPAMVVRLYSGTTATTAQERTALPAGSHLVMSDTGCGVNYVGYTAIPPLLAPTQAVLPLTTVTGPGGTNDTGLLKYPGMPFGKYTVCYDNGTKKYTTTAVNQSTGEIVSLFAGSATTIGKC